MKAWMALLGWAISGVAAADPVALRAPGDGWTVAAAGPALSVGGWFGDADPSNKALRYGAAVEADLRGGPIGISGALGRRVAQGRHGFGVDLRLAGGPVLPLRDPAFALALTPSAALGWRGTHLDFSLGLVTPLVGRVAPDPAFRASVLVEPWLGGNFGPATVGLGAAMGPVLTTGSLFAVDLRWMLAVGLRLP